MSPRKAYEDQRYHAKDRGIEFLITYEEWLEMWLLSGHWPDRGKKKQQYQMCRYGDIGAYTKHNCYIGTVEQNQNDRSAYSDSKVNQIVAAYLNSALSQYEVAKQFGVDQSYVSRVVNGRRRKYRMGGAYVG